MNDSHRCLAKIGLSVAFLVVILCNVRFSTAADLTGGITKEFIQDNSWVALNEPDRFAWLLFVHVNQPAVADSRLTVWESWATDQETFGTGKYAPDNPPVWPGGNLREKVLRASAQQSLVHALPTTPSLEEVRRNKVTFDYIVTNDLWNTNGLVAKFQDFQKQFQDASFLSYPVNPIKFPIDSVEVKANWTSQPITEEEKSRYYWANYQGKPHGLIAMHISSKVLPNWFWCTFEFKDNPLRGKVLGVHDSFGVVPANSVNGKVSPALERLMKEFGLEEVFLNYRLDGAQIDFTDSAGRNRLLGNSITENGFIATSSCMTCHARATTNGSFIPGRNTLNVFVSPLDSPVATSPVPPGTPAAIYSENGAPKPLLFYDSNGKPLFMQLDFVWAFFNAKPKKPVGTD